MLKISSTLDRVSYRFLEMIQLSQVQQPARLWFCVKEYFHGKFYKKDVAQRAKLHSLGFTTPQINDFCKRLCAAGYMWRDPKGNYRIVSMYTICPKAHRPNGKYQQTFHRSIPIEILHDPKLWKKFLRGNVWLAAAESLPIGKVSKEAQCFSAHTNREGVLLHKGRTVPFNTRVTLSSAQGVSLQLMQSRIPRSKATLARWRQAGTVAGFEVYEWVLPLEKIYQEVPNGKIRDYRKFFHHITCDERIKVDPNTLVFRYINGTGKIVTQMPSQIVTSEKVFFMA